VPEPSQTTSWGDVILASLGLAGVLTIAAIALGAILAVGLILWRRRHPAEAEHPPSVTPATPLHRPSAPVQ
jgi:hypothetical protein